MFVLLSAFALVLGCSAVGWWLPADGASSVLVGYAALFIPYALALWQLRDGEHGPHALPAHITALVIAAGAIAARLVLMPAEPLLSDDLYRYVWEGRVTLAGYNPFVFPPESPTLEAVRDTDVWPLINHPEVPTIYPPLSQGLFALNALLGGGTTLMKAILLAFEAAMVALVWRVARHRVSASKLVFAFGVYALNPLVIVEVAWSGHLDVVAWGSLVAGLAIWQLDKTLAWKTVVATGILVGASISAKLLGVLALPFLLTGRFPTETAILPTHLPRRLAALGLALAFVAVSYLPFADAGGKLFSGFGTYAAAWRSNEGGYRAIASATRVGLESLASDEQRATPGDPTSDAVFRFPQWDETFLERGWTKEWRGKTLPNTTFTAYTVAQTAAKVLVAFLCGLALLWLLLGRWQPLAATGVLLFVLYYFAPTVHPWYVAWLVPLAAFRPRLAPLAFSGLVLVGYLAWLSMASGGPWAVPWWAVTIEYGVLAAIVLLPNNTGVIVEELDTFLP